MLKSLPVEKLVSCFCAELTASEENCLLFLLCMCTGKELELFPVSVCRNPMSGGIFFMDWGGVYEVSCLCISMHIN